MEDKVIQAMNCECGCGEDCNEILADEIDRQAKEIEGLKEAAKYYLTPCDGIRLQQEAHGHYLDEKVLREQAEARVKEADESITALGRSFDVMRGRALEAESSLAAANAGKLERHETAMRWKSQCVMAEKENEKARERVARLTEYIERAISWTNLTKPQTECLHEALSPEKGAGE